MVRQILVVPGLQELFVQLWSWVVRRIVRSQTGLGIHPLVYRILIES